MSNPVARCEAAVARKVKDYDHPEELTDWLREHPNELVSDQCRRAASAASGTPALCATHMADHSAGTIHPAIPYVGKGHWEWVRDD